MSLSRGGSRKCGHRYDSGDRCRAWAMRGSDPPRCAGHRLDGGPRVGAPVGNENRLTHGWYQKPVGPVVTIEDAVQNLGEQLARSTEILGQTEDPELFLRIFNLHAQALSRQGRLLRDQRALSGKTANGLLDAIAAAIDEISTEFNIPLLQQD